jgi:hypothetical protein
MVAGTNDSYPVVSGATCDIYYFGAATSTATTTALSADGVLIGSFLFFIFWLLFAGLILDRIIGVKIRRNLYRKVENISRDGRTSDDF